MSEVLERIALKDEIRRRLNADRVWSLYALADLDEELFPQCEWWGLEEEPDALVLVFHGLSIRPIFVLSRDGGTAARLLRGLRIDSGYLNLREEQLEAVGTVFRYAEPHRMQRMVLDIERFAPRAGSCGAAALGPQDALAIERLYAQGDGGGIAFHPSQLMTGLFRGVRDGDGELIAVAGVHVASSNEGVAGVGNIFTHPAHRGRGLAQLTASAVVAAVLAAGIRTIGLNVENTNDAARAAYTKIGFRAAFEYIEGVAQQV